MTQLSISLFTLLTQRLLAFGVAGGIRGLALATLLSAHLQSAPSGVTGGDLGLRPI